MQMLSNCAKLLTVITMGCIALAADRNTQVVFKVHFACTVLKRTLICTSLYTLYPCFSGNFSYVSLS